MWLDRCIDAEYQVYWRINKSCFRAQELRENDKMKQQQTLKEKLKKRSEMKQKQRKEAAAAAASVSAMNRLHLSLANKIQLMT